MNLMSFLFSYYENVIDISLTFRLCTMLMIERYGLLLVMTDIVSYNIDQNSLLLKIGKNVNLNSKSL